MHGTATPKMNVDDPVAQRIADLSAEFLEAGPERRAEIGAEIRSLAAGAVVPFPDPRPR